MFILIKEYSLKMNKKVGIYSSLPKSVLDVSHLIDLEPGTSKKHKSEDEASILGDLIPKKDSQDLQYKVYNLKELINKSSSHRNQHRKSLNSKQRKALFDLRGEKIDLQKCIQINSLWHSYFESILNEVKTKVDELKLARIDYHGSYILVCASKNTSIVGTKGYVVQESKNTFRILTHDHRLLTLPKCGTVFALEHNGKLYKINGYNIMMNSFNRSKVKPKFNYIVDL